MLRILSFRMRSEPNSFNFSSKFSTCHDKVHLVYICMYLSIFNCNWIKLNVIEYFVNEKSKSIKTLGLLVMTLFIHLLFFGQMQYLSRNHYVH